MSHKVKNNIIWIDFKTKRFYDLNKLGHPEKSNPLVPYLCRTKVINATSGLSKPSPYQSVSNTKTQNTSELTKEDIYHD
jgi:hypothetical protein